MKKTIISLAAAALCGVAVAKLPTPVLDDAAKAKAAEAAAKTAWQGKLDAYKLCQAQDRAVAAARRKAGATVPSQATQTVAAKPAAAAPVAAVGAAPAATAAPASGAPAAKPNAAEGGGTPTTAGTPVAAMPAVPPCADPGPFAYAPPQEKPLETSGAHSPAPTATSPPSVRAESATMPPAQPGSGNKP